MTVSSCFLVNQEVDDLFDRYKDIDFIEKSSFRKFAIKFYEYCSFDILNDSIYNVMSIYGVVKAGDVTIIKPFVYIMRGIYNRGSIEDLESIVRSRAFKYVLMDRPGRISVLIKYIDMFKKDYKSYSMDEFCELVCYSYIAHFNMSKSLAELNRLNMLTADAVKSIIECKLTDEDCIIVSNIIHDVGSKCSPDLFDRIFSRIVYFGVDIENACENFMHRNGEEIVRSDLEDRQFVQNKYNEMLKDYIVVNCYGRLWGCSRDAV